jgi:hypothetical protein
MNTLMREQTPCTVTQREKDDITLFYDLLTVCQLTVKQYAGGSEVDITLEGRIPLEASQRMQEVIKNCSGRFAFENIESQ